MRQESRGGSGATPRLRSTGILLAVTLAATSSWVSAAEREPAAKSEPAKEVRVKKSTSGICHDTSSPYFEQTLHFEAFESLDECLASGGRLPKGVAKEVDKLPVRKSRNGICHDAGSPNYPTMKQFETYKSMDACIESGGRPRK